MIMETYRDYEIYPSWIGYGWAHKNYDGAPDSYDNRCGHSHSLEECYGDIDANILDTEESDGVNLG
jgi:hypothetical protein